MIFSSITRASVASFPLFSTVFRTYEERYRRFRTIQGVINKLNFKVQLKLDSQMYATESQKNLEVNDFDVRSTCAVMSWQAKQWKNV